MAQRVFNFNPGPAALPLVVLEQAKMEMLDFQGTGMSILEVSHRSKAFEAVLDSAIQRVRRLLGLDESYHVLFVQGGASLAIHHGPDEPCRCRQARRLRQYGHLGDKGHKGSPTPRQRCPGSRNFRGREFTFIPEEVPLNPDAAYLHITSNNTIRGTQWRKLPRLRARSAGKRHVFGHIQPQVRSAAPSG